MIGSSTNSAGARRPRVDLAALLLAPLGVAIVVLAQAVAGIPASALLQLEAALIVLGGTAGALVLTYAPGELFRTVHAVAATFRSAGDDLAATGAMILALATRAHRRGLLSIDAEIDAVDDPFLREGLALAVDDTTAETLQQILATEAAARQEDDEAPARVLEAAAGYAPTLGILGAVLGLIHVMRSMGGPTGLGKGIAVAFVATVYGVGIANLVLLPLAGRIRERAARQARRRALITAGVCAIQQRQHPRLVAHRLRGFGLQPAALAPGSGGLTAAAPEPATGPRLAVAVAAPPGEERKFA